MSIANSPNFEKINLYKIMIIIQNFNNLLDRDTFK